MTALADPGRVLGRGAARAGGDLAADRCLVRGRPNLVCRLPRPHRPGPARYWTRHAGRLPTLWRLGGLLRSASRSCHPGLVAARADSCDTASSYLPCCSSLCASENSESDSSDWTVGACSLVGGTEARRDCALARTQLSHARATILESAFIKTPWNAVCKTKLDHK